MLAIALTPVARAADLDSLLIQSIGGMEALDSLAQIRSYRAEGAARFNGLHGRFTATFLAPDKLRFDFESSAVNLTQATNGSVAWQRDIQGQPSLLAGAELREFQRSFYFQSFAFVKPEDKTGAREYIDLVVRDGQSYHGAVLYPHDADTVMAYFDVTTGRCHMQAARFDNIEIETIFGDYRFVAGVLFPFHTYSSSPNSPIEQEYTVDSIAVNVSVDSNLFEMPVDRSANFRFPAGADSVQIAIEYRNGHLLVPVVINGRKLAWFILDSGASATLCDRPALADFDLATLGSAPSIGVGGYDNTDLVKIDSLAIGGVTLYDRTAGRMDLSGLRSGFPSEKTFGGLLGYDFLSTFPVLVDYRSELLTIYGPAGFLPPEAGINVPFELSISVPVIEGRLDGHEGSFIVDLGNAFGLIVHHQFAESKGMLKRLDSTENGSVRLGGIGSPSSGTPASVDSFFLGDAVITNPPTIITTPGEGLVGSAELAGNIGSSVLEKFRVLFLYQESRIILYPHAP
jgi:hypothetical protein